MIPKFIIWFALCRVCVSVLLHIKPPKIIKYNKLSSTFDITTSTNGTTSRYEDFAAEHHEDSSGAAAFSSAEVDEESLDYDYYQQTYDYEESEGSGDTGAHYDKVSFWDATPATASDDQPYNESTSSDTSEEARQCQLLQMKRNRPIISPSGAAVLNPYNVEASKAASYVIPLYGNTSSYSGYLCVNERYGAYLYFWFVHSHSNPSTSPLVVWLQGQPGTSVLVGFFEEHGPYQLNNDGVLHPRQFSWAREFNVLYLDHCIPCGFSYADDEAGWTSTVEASAEAVYLALLQFFAVFTEFATNEVYLAGEYGCGKIIPAICATIHSRNKNAGGSNATAAAVKRRDTGAAAAKHTDAGTIRAIDTITAVEGATTAAVVENMDAAADLLAMADVSAVAGTALSDTAFAAQAKNMNDPAVAGTDAVEGIDFAAAAENMHRSVVADDTNTTAVVNGDTALNEDTTASFAGDTVAVARGVAAAAAGITPALINLKGAMIGNGLVDINYMVNYGQVWYHWGLADPQIRQSIGYLEEVARGYIRAEYDDDVLNYFRYHIFVKLSERDFNSPYDVRYVNASLDEKAAAYVDERLFRQWLHVGNATYHFGHKYLSAKLLKDVRHQLPELLRHYKIMYYNGQFDPLFPHHQASRFLQTVGWSELDKWYRSERQNWYVGDRLLGYSKSHAKLTQVLVRNAGHMVGQTQPETLFHLLKWFVYDMFPKSKQTLE